MYGETFYGRHTAQHQLQWSQSRSTKLIPGFKNLSIEEMLRELKLLTLHNKIS